MSEARAQGSVTENGSRAASKAAVICAMTDDISEEKSFMAQSAEKGIKLSAVSFGGEYITSVSKIIERAIISAKREGVISGTHAEEGAVAGAAHEAVAQIMAKAIGLNVGGKIAVARSNEHIAVALFIGIGLVHLNEIGIGLGHRAIS